MIKLCTLAVALAATVAATAGEINFNYQTSADDELQWWGTGKKDTYDIAILVKNPSLVGKTITGLRVPVVAENATATSMWLTTKLALKKVDNKKVNDADICTQEAEVKDGFLDVTFAEPYTITEEGVYAGYTIDITDAATDEAKLPIAVYSGKDQDGLWVHSRRMYISWNHINQPYVSALEVRIDGMPDRAAAVSSIPTVRVKQGDETVVPAYFANHGSEPITSLTYSYKIGDKTGESTLEFTEPVQALFNAQVPFELPIPALDELGTTTSTITIDKVNGKDNQDDAPTYTFDVNVLSFVPVYRQLVEEYTGFWCGWCVRGYAALERMNAEHGSDFVAAAYHNGDPISTLKDNEWPNSVPGYPGGFLNRSTKLNMDYEQLASLWENGQGEFPDAGIELTATWRDSEHTIIDVTSVTRFCMRQTGSKYRLAYLLIGNGMQDKSWGQSNYYTDQVNNGDPYMQMFYKGEKTMYDLPFNDVVLFSPYAKGLPVYPTDFEAGEELTNEQVFFLADANNLDGKNLAEYVKYYTVIAVVLDSNGNFINCNRCEVSDLVSIVENLSEKDETPVYYDLMGQRTVNPNNGVYIRILNGKASKIKL